MDTSSTSFILKSLDTWLNKPPVLNAGVLQPNLHSLKHVKMVKGLWDWPPVLAHKLAKTCRSIPPAQRPLSDSGILVTRSIVSPLIKIPHNPHFPGGGIKVWHVPLLDKDRALWASCCKVLQPIPNYQGSQGFSVSSSCNLCWQVCEPWRFPGGWSVSINLRPGAVYTRPAQKGAVHTLTTLTCSSRERTPPALDPRLITEFVESRIP